MRHRTRLTRLFEGLQSGGLKNEERTAIGERMQSELLGAPRCLTLRSLVRERDTVQHRIEAEWKTGDGFFSACIGAALAGFALAPTRYHFFSS